MLIIGCDFHTPYLQIAMAREETGELLVERRLDHESGEAHAFYRSLREPVRVGMEATGPIHWFERLLAGLGHELWIGDSAKIRASEVRKQKTDERDAAHILDLLLAKRFPRIWVSTPAERDLRQLLWHRHKLVCLRTMLGNQLHALAMSQGLCRKRKLFTKKGRVELAAVVLAPWASRRREELLKLLDQLEAPIAELDHAVLEEANRREDAARLMTHPGIGPVNALAFVLAIGPVARFRRSKKIASYLGLNPSEESSGGRRRLGAISKQGNTMVRWLLRILNFLSSVEELGHLHRNRPSDQLSPRTPTCYLRPRRSRQCLAQLPSQLPQPPLRPPPGSPLTNCIPPATPGRATIEPLFFALCFHTLTNCYSRKSFILIII